MNKYLRLHIDQATKATRRNYNVARIVAKLLGMIVAAYAAMILIWYCVTVWFAITPQKATQANKLCLGWTPSPDVTKPASGLLIAVNRLATQEREGKNGKAMV